MLTDVMPEVKVMQGKDVPGRKARREAVVAGLRRAQSSWEGTQRVRKWLFCSVSVWCPQPGSRIRGYAEQECHSHHRTSCLSCPSGKPSKKTPQMKGQGSVLPWGSVGTPMGCVAQVARGSPCRGYPCTPVLAMDSPWHSLCGQGLPSLAEAFLPSPCCQCLVGSVRTDSTGP